MKLLERLGLRRRPLISVVVASYNHGAYVEDCLRSALDQVVPADLEIVVTDDGSSDDTVTRIQALQDPRIRLHVLPHNRGACIALNDAILRARGAFIAVLNSDDYFLPGKLAQQLQYLQAHPRVGAVFGLPAFINEQGQVYDDPRHRDHKAFVAGERSRFQWLRHFFDQGNALCHPTVLVRREVYQRIGLYDPRLAQVPDLDMWIRLASHTPLHVLAQPLTAFRVRDGLQNASAGRPEVIVRDAWERARILRHYLDLSDQDLLQVFPEFAGSGEPFRLQLARYALTLPYPFFHRFALDAWFDLLPGGQPPAELLRWMQARPGDWREFILHTGQIDLHNIRP